jgi:hypothetical protein
MDDDRHKLTLQDVPFTVFAERIYARRKSSQIITCDTPETAKDVALLLEAAIIRRAEANG